MGQPGPTPPLSVPVPDKRNSADYLENFAQRVEARLRLGKDQGEFAMERLVCRLLMSKDPRVAAVMVKAWADWRYGKATEHIHMTGNVTHEHVDLSKLSEEEFEPIKRLIESAHEGTDSR